jgi:hypothetical protein
VSPRKAVFAGGETGMTLKEKGRPLGTALFDRVWRGPYFWTGGFTSATRALVLMISASLAVGFGSFGVAATEP